MNTRWILQSRISKTSHQRPAPDSGSPARQGPSWCSPWLVPSATIVSLPEEIQFEGEEWWVMPFNVAPTSPNNLPMSSLPLAKPHFGKYTCASLANSDRMLSPVDVMPPLSNALRYSIATDLRCSSVIV